MQEPLRPPKTAPLGTRFSGAERSPRPEGQGFAHPRHLPGFSWHCMEMSRIGPPAPFLGRAVMFLGYEPVPDDLSLPLIEELQPKGLPKNKPNPTITQSIVCWLPFSEHLQQTGIPSGSQDKVSVPDSGPEVAEPQVAEAPVVTSKLSAKAPEFYPSGYNQNFSQNFTDSSFEDRYDGYLTLAEYVQDFLNHLTEQPGCFETEIEQFAETLNVWVAADEGLQELVELVYQQATSVPNFSYLGARLCNYLSHHLTISPQSGNFRQLLLQRCRTEYENRDEATKGDETTRKQFHAFVLFLAELYLNLEIKGSKGQVTRAEILQEGLRELLNALFSNPVDSNLICAVKLLKLTGSVLEDAWKEKGKNDMEEVIQRIENVVLDANCSRDVKHMLLKLVELRSSNWGRVYGTSPRTEATPENDPNYFMITKKNTKSCLKERICFQIMKKMEQTYQDLGISILMTLMMRWIQKLKKHMKSSV
ncbi:polyadenylate-binding protein-interacting protein 1 isoform X3 [Pelecanus crispus]|uniref:polyadenylate-binding protein-interacting protein 1 isoform X3 n=1 Tax=Pelecanus crispus TaxID=36300 RepID=UPI003F5D2102